MAEPTSPPGQLPTGEGPTPPPASPPTSLDADWPKQATDAVVRVVDAVRDKTTGPAVNAAHAVKYGIVVAILALPLFVIFLVGLMRFSEAVVHNLAELSGVTNSLLLEPMWLVYLFWGGLFWLVGLLLWRKANKPARRP